MCKAIIALLPILIIGCATNYIAKGGDSGYSSMQINESSYRVSFDGNELTSAERATDFALLRCAELTMNGNFRFFTIIRDESFVEKKEIVEPSTISIKTEAVAKDSTHTTTTITPGRTTSHSMPRISYIITCMNEKPNQLYYDAKIISDEIRRKYKISPSAGLK